MLHRAISAIRSSASAAISRFYQGRYHPHAVLAPSGRFGIYAVASELFSEGHQVLISPLTCRTVVEALLAAGAVPAFVDIDMETGNIDLRRLSGDMLKASRGLITTNLYGNPDDAIELRDIARKHGLSLIEDCAHVLHTTLDSRRIGTLGDVSIFSFKKYFQQPGGIVTTRDAFLARRVAERIARHCTTPPYSSEAARLSQYSTERSFGCAVTRRVSRLARAIHAPAVPVPLPAAPGSQFVRAALPAAAALLRVSDCLAVFDAMVETRKREAEFLVRESRLAPRRSARSDDICYLVVPFWSAARDQMIARLQDRGIATYFTYCPPLDQVFGDKARCDYLTPERLREWCARILPVDVRNGRAFLEEIAACR